MTFFNTCFESTKEKMNGLEKQAKSLAQEAERLRTDSAKLKKRDRQFKIRH